MKVEGLVEDGYEAVRQVFQRFWTTAGKQGRECRSGGTAVKSSGWAGVGGCRTQPPLAR